MSMIIFIYIYIYMYIYRYLVEHLTLLSHLPRSNMNLKSNGRTVSRL